MDIRKILKVSSVISLVAILASCTYFQPVEEKLPPLRVEYTNWWGDFTILVAQELGLFKKYGVDVEPVYFEVLSSALPELATGSVDGGLFSLDEALITDSKSALVLVALYDDGGYNYVVGSSEIKTPADLRGRKIGVNLGTIGELFVMRALIEGSLTTRDVVLIDTDAEDIPSAIGSEIDAGYAGDPYASEVLAAGGNLLYRSGGTNSITPNAIVFRKDVVQQRPDDIRAFLQAWFEAVDYRNANPEQANQLIASAMRVSVDEIAVNSTLFTAKDNGALFSDQPSAGQTNLKKALNTNAEFLIRIGALSKKPIQNELIDPGYLPLQPVK